MKSKLLSDTGVERRIVAVFDVGDEVVATCERFAYEQQISAASFTAIGAFSSVRLGYFDCASRKYLEIPVDEQVEVLSLAGVVALSNGRPKLHAHAVLGRRDGSARGGHLLAGYVRPTLELMLVESAATLVRTFDESTGLALIDLRH